DPQAPFAPPLQEPIWLEPYPDEWLPDFATDPETEFTQRERVSLAFLIALQHLPPRQRAALLLSDVLDWRASEIAEALEMTVSAVNSALHRARETLTRRPPAQTARAGATTEALLARYVRAWEEADIGSLVALLKEEAIFAMPPSPSWYAGRNAIGTFVGGTMLNPQMRGVWRLVLTQANGDPACALFQCSAETGDLQPVAVQTLTVEDGQITAIHSFMRPDLVARFVPSAR
ncbi:MAG: RNA polymerase subunit sigma-70, partial [Anaerolineales bacterium]|nr:RNA polymerase subunit sigma-70 [Anaerolineales bacterium]